MVTGGELRFYTMADRRYFLGLVGLVNSLRLQGHDEEVVVLDLGLTAAQRATLQTECRLVDRSRVPDAPPQLLKPFPQVLDHHGPMIFIDSDVIVTAHLRALESTARSGKVAVFPDYLRHRWVEAWKPMFDLATEPRHDVYVNAGVVAFSTEHFQSLLPRWWNACLRLADGDLSAEEKLATVFADQDALNAILMSELPPGSVELLAPAECPMGPDELALTAVLDPRTVSCRCRSIPTKALHATKTPKPWVHESVLRRPWNAYHACLQRLLCDPNLAIRVQPSDVPWFLRPTATGRTVKASLRVAGPAYTRSRALARKARAAASKA